MNPDAVGRLRHWDCQIGDWFPGTESMTGLWTLLPGKIDVHEVLAFKVNFITYRGNSFKVWERVPMEEIKCPQTKKDDA